MSVECGSAELPLTKMESRIFIFAAVLMITVQSSSAAEETKFLSDLAKIRAGEQGTLEAFYSLLEDFIRAVYSVANAISEHRVHDAKLMSEMESIERRLIADLTTALHETLAGLKPITRNSSAITNSEDEKIRELLTLVFRPIKVIIRAENYHEALMTINAIEKTAMPLIDASTLRVYNTFRNAIGDRHMPISNAIHAITVKAIGNCRTFYKSIFNVYRILLLVFSGKLEAKSKSFISAIETEKSLARVCLDDEGHTKFAFFEYVLAARKVVNIEIIRDNYQIQIAELGALNQYEAACEFLFGIMIRLAENKHLACPIETLSDKLLVNLYPALLASEVTMGSFLTPENASEFGMDHGAAYEKLRILSIGITNAIHLTQQSQTYDVLRAKIDVIEKKIVPIGVNVFDETIIAMENMASNIGPHDVAIFRRYLEISSVVMHRVFIEIFRAIKYIPLFRGTSKDQPEYCDTGVSAIKIARDAVFAGVKNKTMFDYSLIRRYRWSDFLNTNGVDQVPHSLLHV